jgi:gamma-glutamyltranspeptidase/glutathione hydrolase
MDILKKGGNAIDAAIATAAALTVVEPTSNGLGSDAFAIIWHDGRLHGINGSGRSPASLSLEKLKSLNLDEIPRFGWAAATVPGAPGTWAELSSRMGRLPLSETLAPAIEYARGGFAVAVNVSRFWKKAASEFSGLSGDAHAGWFEMFCPDGKAPLPGETFKAPEMARTFEEIAGTGGRSFYSGETAEKIIRFSRASGGFFSEGDLSSFAPQWTSPMRVNYKGYDVWEMPPNGQGVVALMALGILGEFDFAGHGAPETIHRQIEAIKLGFADAMRYVADPEFARVPSCELISDPYLAGRRRMIGDRAAEMGPGDPYSGGTVYLCTADGDGSMVSYIQSNFNGFGSGIVIPGTGISLNNRAACFSRNAGHPNALSGGKRPYNTIIPGFITKRGAPVGPFGVMGAYMQPQGHLQVVMNLVDFHMNPQEALDAPRWQWVGGMDVSFEPAFGECAAAEVGRMGHRVSFAANPFEFGRGQMIHATEYGTLVGATEPRTDGCVEAW